MSNPKPPRARRAPHRPSFGEIERILPAPSSKEAKLLAHILRCEACTDAALSILKLGGGPPHRGGKADYCSTFASVEAKTEKLFASHSEQSQRVASHSQEILSSPKDDVPNSLFVQLLSRFQRVEGIVEEADVLLKQVVDLLGEGEEDFDE